MRLSVAIARSIRDAPPAWDAFCEDLPPFVGRAWLAATEADGPVAREDGWEPHHVILLEKDVPVAAIPLYVRDRSDGEFYWHGTMEEALDHNGLPSAPRAVSTAPATPVPSARLLTAPDWRDAPSRRRVLGVLGSLADSLGWASTHVQFCAEEEALPAAEGWFHRMSRQARWRREGAETVEDWLAGYRAKRRTSIRREMRELDDQGLRLRWVRAVDAPDSLFARAAELHERTATSYGEHVRFGPRFFEALSAPPLRESVLFSVAEKSDGEAVGIATMVVHDGVLYGRLWGAADRIRFLHFNIALYGGIRYCIEHGLERFEPGHGGFHKDRRGFPTEATHSLHRYLHPGAHAAFSNWADKERTWMRERIKESRAESGLK